MSIDDLLDTRWRTFFEWASTSPLSRPAYAARLRHVELAEEAASPPDFLRTETAGLNVLRGVLRGFLGVPAEHTVVFGRSAAELMSLIATGLPAPAGRDVVILVGPNHPVAALSWLGAARTRKIQVHHVDHDELFRADIDRLARVIDSRCLAVCVTHVTHLHGGIQPVREIAEITHAAGALCIVDGAQAVGRVPVDITGLGCDIYIGVGRKAMLAPIGTAFLTGPTELLSRIDPLVWSTRSAELASPAEARPGDVPARLEGSLPDLPALYAFEASARALDAAGVERFQADVQRMLPSLVDGMARHGIRAVSPAGGTGVVNAGIVTFAAPSAASGLDLQARYREAGFVVAADQETIRVSLHARNDMTSIDALCRENE
jgi:cysteine desulfurase/selenocysteine lyase